MTMQARWVYKPIYLLLAGTLCVSLLTGIAAKSMAADTLAGSLSRPLIAVAKPLSKPVKTGKDNPGVPVGETLAKLSLESLVQKGNAAANSQNYPEAIRYYEQIVAKAPGEKTLKNNLAVLYANNAVALQDKNDFEGARTQYDKALALVTPKSPDQKNFQEAKANAYYGQAMAIRAQQVDVNDNASAKTPDYLTMRSLVSQAIALSPQEGIYQKGMASIYLDEAYALATQENYAAAAPLMEKALTYDGQSESIKQSLANVYLGLGRNDIPNRKAWVAKALAVDSSPRVKITADQVLALGNDADGAASTLPAAKPQKAGIKGLFAPAPSESKAAMPKIVMTLSVNDMLGDMEKQLGQTPAKGSTLQARLEVIEKQVYGTVQSGPLATRTKSAYASLMGGTKDAGTDPAQVIQAPAEASENSYLVDIFKVTDGKVVRWGKFPLRVYIETPKDNKLYKPEYKEAALFGLNAWKVKSNNFVNYVEIKNMDAADIQILWSDAYVDRFADPANTPAMYRTYTPYKRSPMLRAVQMASMFTPGYFSLGPQALGAAMQYKQMKKLEILKEESIIHLGLAPTKALPPEAAKLLIQNMAAKEFGHALGLKANSPEKGDLLYPELRSDVVQLPSNRDLETLRDLYSRPPNIVLNYH